MNATSVSPSQTSHHLVLLTWWVLASVLGWFIGELAGFILGSVLATGVLITVGVSAGVGLMQWLVLRSAVPRSGWWAPACIAGVAGPLLLYRLIVGEPPEVPWAPAIIGGALAGVLQGRILRRSVAHPWWWVLASAAGWALSHLGALVGHSMSDATCGPGSPVTAMLCNFLLPAIPQGLLLGAVTGGALVWLLREPAHVTTRPGETAAAPRRLLWRVLLIAAAAVAALAVLLLYLPLILLNLTIPARYQPLVGQGREATYVRGAAFSPDGALLATTSLDRGAAIFDVATGAKQLALPGAMQGSDIAFSPDGSLVAVAYDATVRMWDAETGASVRGLTGLGQTLRVSFSPDGALLAVGSDTGDVKLIDVTTGAVARTLSGHTFWVHDVAFSPDGSLLASASGDGTVKLWDVATGAEQHTIQGKETWMLGVAFSPDGRLLATTGRDHAVQLWDVVTAGQVRTLKGHRGWVWRAAFSPDGTLLATASDDKTVRLWEVATDKEARVLRGHDWWVRGLAFSPDGATLASASFDGTVKLWDVATGAELRSIPWPDTP